MEFSKLTYPLAPVMNTELLGSTIAAGYSCSIERCKDTPHFVVKINGESYVVKVTSIFKTIIETVGIEPNEDYISNDVEGRSVNSKKGDTVSIASGG